MIRLLTTPLSIDDIERFAQAGADGLIFGTSFFSVRSAAYFDECQYVEIRKRCTQAQVEMLVLLNRFFVEEELPRLYQHLQFLKEIDVDGIYFSDEAVLAYAKSLDMVDRLIYQPDTLLTNHPDVNYYLKEGCKHVMLSKEITLEEITEIAKHSQPERLELILHGRVVMMHSKRPLLSHYMAFTQQDHMVKNNPHLIIEEETRKDRMPILEDEQGTHVFSAYVLESFKEVQAFLGAGIGTGKIDGIFQNATSIETTVRLYDALRKQELTWEEARACYQQAFPEEPLDSGFYYRATSTTK